MRFSYERVATPPLHILTTKDATSRGYHVLQGKSRKRVEMGLREEFRRPATALEFWHIYVSVGTGVRVVPFEQPSESLLLRFSHIIPAWTRRLRSSWRNSHQVVFAHFKTSKRVCLNLKKSYSSRGGN